MHVIKQFFSRYFLYQGFILFKVSEFSFIYNLPCQYYSVYIDYFQYEVISVEILVSQHMQI